MGDLYLRKCNLKEKKRVGRERKGRIEKIIGNSETEKSKTNDENEETLRRKKTKRRK